MREWCYLWGAGESGLIGSAFIPRALSNSDFSGLKETVECYHSNSSWVDFILNRK